MGSSNLTPSSAPRAIPPEPSPAPQSHPDTRSTRLHPSQQPPITCREHTSHGPRAPPAHHSLHGPVPASSVTQISPPMAGRLWKGAPLAQPPESLSPPFTGCPHSAGPQPNPKALRGQGHPKASLMASLPSTEPQQHPPCPASPWPDSSSHPQHSPARVTTSAALECSFSISKTPLHTFPPQLCLTLARSGGAPCQEPLSHIIIPLQILPPNPSLA